MLRMTTVQKITKITLSWPLPSVNFGPCMCALRLLIEDCRVLIKTPFCVCLYCSQLLSAVLLLLRLWDSGTREMDNERSTQGTSAPLLPLLQRFQNIHSSKEEPVPEEEIEVRLNP